MNSTKFKNTVCRICLDENVILDWNNTLAEQDDITYKDCYYKYTQLEPLAADPFSSMLCQSCLNSLENTNALILKALDSYNFLLEVNCLNSNKYDLTIEDCTEQTTDFETVLVEKSHTESQTQDQYVYESVDVFFTTEKYKDDNFKGSVTHTEMKKEESVDTKVNVSKLLETNIKSQKNKDGKIILLKTDSACNENNFNKKLSIAHYNTLHSEITINKEDEEPKQKTEKTATTKRRIRRTKYKMKNTPSMCSYCSKILHSKYSLIKHERTHIVNRERKATCPICGVKFFEEAHVKMHMKIHKDSREKAHKCEFCDKAFFDKGALNVHRRIHLGQMVPCNLCPKKFVRQVDLDIHMNSHSATLISVETKKKSRYLVRCKYCNKNIMSTSFKSHTAAHLNEPLMKCSICNKEFFRRDSCTQHLKSIHHKSTEEYNEFIVLYSTNRLSHLYLEQTAEIQSNED